MIARLLLGPSGVGKSSLGQGLAAQLPGHRFADLDQLLARLFRNEDLTACLIDWGFERFHRRGLACLYKLDRRPEPWIVAVGAGSQFADGGSGELLSWPSLCLWAEPAWLLERNRRLFQDPRDLETFIKGEYSPEREALYESCNVRLDLSGLSQPEAQALLLQTLTEAP